MPKISDMRKYIVILLIGLYSFCSCQDENSSLGQNLVETSFRNMVTDTCTVKFSTILVDSLATLGDTICQIGFYKDSIWGKVQASYIAEINKNSFMPDLTLTYVFDSLTLVLQPSGHYWGDTLTSQRIYVHELEAPITLNADEKLYNTSSIAYREEPLCSFDYKLFPKKKKEVEVRVSDKLGMRLFEDMLAEKEVFDSQENFRNYLPGLAFVGDENGTCISGFETKDSLFYLKMYYHSFGNNRTDHELTMSINRSYAYTKIMHDRTGTTIEGLNGGGALYATPSEQTNHCTYLQGLTGIYNSIEFPHLNNLMAHGDIISIESAMLYLYPLKGSYGIVDELPSTLQLYIADEKNNTVDQVYDDMGTDIQNGSLTTDEVHKRDAFYTFDLTSFLQDNLGTWGQNRQKLFLILDNDNFLCTLNHVVFTNDRREEQRQTKLEVRYKIYNRK